MNRKLYENGGIPSVLLFMMALMTGISVANIYYCQPLLSAIGADLGIDEFRSGMIAAITQAGYACGLFFVIPTGDMFNRRKIVSTFFMLLAAALLVFSLSRNYATVMASSFVIGLCSVMPQIFIPIAAQFSVPGKKNANVGKIVSGLLVGILASRVISGLVGEWFGWRTMYVAAAVVMFVCTAAVMAFMPSFENNFKGTYASLMKSLWQIVRKYPELRLCSLRSAFAFGSFLALWSSLVFRMEDAPFHAGSDVVGMLGLCGVAGAVMASFIGKYIERVGVRNFNITGCLLILVAWLVLFVLDGTYFAVIAGILLMDIGMQCIQLSNQSVIFSLEPKASNRLNTVFMTCYFIGGTLGTFLSGSAWSLMRWNGVLIAGAVLVTASLGLTLFFDRKCKDGVS